MRAVLLVLLTACSGGRAPTPVARPAIANATHSCREAAVNLERATRDVRAPETSIVRAMDDRCVADRWPGRVVDCFATMDDGELARCATLLADGPREAMLGVITGGGDRSAIEVARLRLRGLEVGVGECNRFVAAVASVLRCEQMPLDARVQLGNETAELWDLPTQGLPPDAQQRMAEACGVSLQRLQAEASNAGCAL
jgi:hypothetical protein